MAVVNTGMGKGDMRKLLNRSKEEPVHCAVGMGDNPAVGLLVMHKSKKDRAVEALLKADFPTAKNTRWGMAFVDIEDNPKLVKFTLNKPVSGMARKLIKTLKGTGFSKVIILTEDGSLMDTFEEEDEEAGLESGAQAGAEAGGVPADTAASSAIPAPPTAPPPPVGATPEEKAAQKAALSKVLAGLMAAIPGAAGGDAAVKATLEKLAKDAVVNIQTGNLTYGANAIAQLKKALEGGAAAPPAAPPSPGAEPTPEQKAAQKAALAKELSGLAAAVAGSANGDAGRKAALDKLVREAAVNIQTGNLTYGANSIAQLKKALEGGPRAQAPGAQTGAQTGAGAAAPALAASRVAWTGVRQQVAADVDTLRAALASTYDGLPVAGEVVARFQAKVAPVLARFDDRLGVALDGVAAETDAEKRAALQADARRLAQEYLAFAEGDALIGDLDANPFVPLTIRSKTVAALSAVAQAIG